MGLHVDRELNAMPDRHPTHQKLGLSPSYTDLPLMNFVSLVLL